MDIHTLPYNIILEIIRHIEPNKSDFGNFRKVCKRFATITRDKRYYHLITCRAENCSSFTTAYCGHISCILHLYAKKLGVTNTLRHYLAYADTCDVEVVKYLVEKGGANIHCGDMAMSLAQERDSSDIVEYFISKGVHRVNLLRITEENNYHETVKYLSNIGFDINMYQQGALKWLCRFVSLECIKKEIIFTNREIVNRLYRGFLEKNFNS